MKQARKKFTMLYFTILCKIAVCKNLHFFLIENMLKVVGPNGNDAFSNIIELLNDLTLIFFVFSMIGNYVLIQKGILLDVALKGTGYKVWSSND